MTESRNGRTKSIVAGAALVLVAVTFAPTPATAATGTNTRVSVASDGTQGNEASVDAALTADGRYVALTSSASNLVSGDTNNSSDVFVHDRQTGSITRMSKASDGTQGNGSSSGASISADGRYVAFESAATNLVAGDTNTSDDVFVHDRQAGTTTRVSVASNGTQGNGPSRSPDISADGNYVAFHSSATLAGNDTNLSLDVFVHDRQSGSTTRVSVPNPTPLGPTEANFHSGGVSLSADGRHVAFTSSANNLVVGDANSTEDVFVHDRQTGSTTRASVSSLGVEARGGASDEASISADGRSVAFHSQADNLVLNDTNNGFDAFVHDRETGSTTRVSVASDGTQAGGEAPSVSAQGRYVTFSARSPNLVAGDTNGVHDTFVHDRTTGVTTRVSVADTGAQGNDESIGRDISADGRYVAFDSRATNLVRGDTNNFDDVFVHDRDGVPAPPPVVVAVGDVTVHEGDTGTRAAVFTVSLSKPSDAAVTVAYATAAGTADATDYTPKSGSVSFAAGATSATVKIPVTGDTADEGEESFTVGLSAPTNAVIGDATGVGTIFDDDPGTGRRLAIGDVAVHEGDAGARAAVFTVSLSKPSTSNVTVNYATAKGSALGTDFTAKSGTLSFAPGTTTLSVKVAITPDTLPEGTETFSVNLSAPSGAIIADGIGVGTIIDND